MKAILLEDYWKIRLVETDPPVRTGEDQVLIRVTLAGVCGSEIHAYKGTHPFRRPPAIMGHELTGIVAEVGTACNRIKPGDRVTVDPQWTCDTCEWCRTGRHNICKNKTVLGTTSWPGAFGEYVVIPEKRVYPIPENLEDILAVTVEPLSVGMHAADRASIQRGESAVIYGCGTIGLATVAGVRERGASRIVAVDIRESSLDAARKIGATATVTAGTPEAGVSIRAGLGSEQADMVFVTVGMETVFHDALSVVKPGGRIILIALFDKPVSFEPFDLVGTEVSVIGSQMYTPEDVERAILSLSEGRIDFSPVVTHCLPLESAQRAFDLAGSKDDGAIKVILKHGETHDGT